MVTPGQPDSARGSDKATIRRDSRAALLIRVNGYPLYPYVAMYAPIDWQ